MSNPSFSNIDLWLFERAEGNLSPEQLEQLDMFLLRNPELDIERDVWEMAKVEKHVYIYPEMASLERKRRPVAAFGLMAFFLLFAGTTSYLFWNGTSEAEATHELIARQNADVKHELFQQLKDVQLVKSSVQAEATPSSELHKAASNSNAFLKTLNSSTFVRNENQRTAQTSTQININAISSREAGAIEVGVTAQTGSTEIQNPIERSVPETEIARLNGAEIALETIEILDSTEPIATISTESSVPELISADVNQINNSSESDPFGGSKWNPNRTRSNVAFTSHKSNYEKSSFKDRLSTFARNLDRMMSAPIALKNSREPHYHVPGLTANDISFSTAGTLIATRVQATSRIQWLGRENEQFSNQLSVDGYSRQMRGGWGLQLNHQWYKDGGIQVAQAAVTYSPKISVSRFISVEPSVRFKMGNKQLNSNQLSDVEMVELERGNEQDFYPNGGSPIGKNLWYKDLGLGMLVNTKWFFAGAQLDNLFKHKDNLYDNNWSDPRRAQNYFTATIGTDWLSRNEKLKFSPYIVYQKNERLSEAWAGASFSWNWLSIGAAASSNLEPAASLGVRFDHFSLLYNVDYTHSRMLNEKALSHQVTLRFVGKRNHFGK